jgi:hypothetical protein
MATKATGRKLSEAELNASDLDDDGNLDVETFPVPDGSAIEDPYLKNVWQRAVKDLDANDEEE